MCTSRKSPNRPAALLLLLTATCSLAQSVVPIKVTSLVAKSTRTCHSLVAANNRLFFVTVEDGVGARLWSSTGGSATAGTILLAEGLDQHDLAVFNNTVYFARNNDLCTTTGVGTANSLGMTTYCQVIGPGIRPVLSNTATLNNSMYFRSSDDRKLYRTNGTAAGTVLVKDLGTTTMTGAFCKAGANVYFVANDPLHGEELYRTDGTAAGTGLLKDITPGAVGSFQRPLAEAVDFNGKLLFQVYVAATATTPEDYRPWISDGTTAGTTVVKNISSNADWVGNFLSLGGVAIFPSYTTANGRIDQAGIWSTDGTSSGTKRVLLMDNPRDPIYYLGKLIVTDGYTVTIGGQGQKRERLKAADITAGTAETISIDNKVFLSITNKKVCNGRLYFKNTVRATATTPSSSALWELNLNGVRTLRQVVPALAPKGDPGFSDLLAFNNVLYFFADYDGKGPELWKVQYTF